MNLVPLGEATWLDNTGFPVDMVYHQEALQILSRLGDSILLNGEHTGLQDYSNWRYDEWVFPGSVTIGSDNAFYVTTGRQAARISERGVEDLSDVVREARTKSFESMRVQGSTKKIIEKNGALYVLQDSDEYKEFACVVEIGNDQTYMFGVRTGMIAEFSSIFADMDVHGDEVFVKTKSGIAGIKQLQQITSLPRWHFLPAGPRSDGEHIWAVTNEDGNGPYLQALDEQGQTKFSHNVSYDHWWRLNFEVSSQEIAVLDHMHHNITVYEKPVVERAALSQPLKELS